MQANSEELSSLQGSLTLRYTEMLHKDQYKIFYVKKILVKLQHGTCNF